MAEAGPAQQGLASRQPSLAGERGSSTPAEPVAAKPSRPAMTSGSASSGHAEVAAAVELSKQAVAKDAAGDVKGAIALYQKAVDLLSYGISQGMGSHLLKVRKAYIDRLVAMGGVAPSISAATGLSRLAMHGLAGSEALNRFKSVGGLVAAGGQAVNSRSLLALAQAAAAGGDQEGMPEMALRVGQTPTRVRQRQHISLFSPRAARRDGQGPTLVDRALNIANTVSFQLALYLAYVFVYQSLASTMRVNHEYYFTRAIMARLVERPFGPQHRSFMSLRRTDDVYAWADQVLWPALFGLSGPCNPSVGLNDTHGLKGCDDFAWADGEGPEALHGTNVTPPDPAWAQRVGPTPYLTRELVPLMDQFDWTEGLVIKQVSWSGAEGDGREGRMPSPNER